MAFGNLDLKETSRFAQIQLGLQRLWPRRLQSGQQPRGGHSQFSCGCAHIPEKEWYGEGFVVWGGVQSAVVRETWWQEWPEAVVAEVSGCLL